MLHDHACPRCGVTLGVLVPASKVENPGAIFTICIVCSTFLRVEEWVGKRAQVREMSEEEILAMPDGERIALSRVAKITGRYTPEMLKAGMEMREKFQKTFTENKDEIVRELDKKITALFGNEIGCVLILKHMNPMGAQGMTTNLRDELLETVLKDSLKSIDGTNERLMRRILDGEG